MKQIRKLILPVITAAAYLVVFLLDRDMFLRAGSYLLMFLKEMLEVMPAVFVLTGLLTVWVPRETIVRHLGSSSGLKGRLISFAVGSVSAGPIYAAFPVGRSLLDKGASVGNVVTIISAWAVVKIPMLIVEAKFLGIPFTAVRYLLTVPAILGIAALTGKLINRAPNSVSPKPEESLADRYSAVLPQHDCGACGFATCAAYAAAIADNSAASDRCVPGGEPAHRALDELMAANGV